jgi:hypothetical protein
MATYFFGHPTLSEISLIVIGAISIIPALKNAIEVG